MSDCVAAAVYDSLWSLCVIFQNIVSLRTHATKSEEIISLSFDRNRVRIGEWKRKRFIERNANSFFTIVEVIGNASTTHRFGSVSLFVCANLFFSSADAKQQQKKVIFSSHYNLYISGSSVGCVLHLRFLFIYHSKCTATRPTRIRTNSNAWIMNMRMTECGVEEAIWKSYALCIPKMMKKVIWHNLCCEFRKLWTVNNLWYFQLVSVCKFISFCIHSTLSCALISFFFWHLYVCARCYGFAIRSTNKQNCNNVVFCLVFESVRSLASLFSSCIFRLQCVLYFLSYLRCIVHGSVCEMWYDVIFTEYAH